MNQTKQPEVLAPAGDMESLEAAVRFGADAVYLGGTTMGMRASSKNFDMQQLQTAVNLAHSQGVKVFFTCNTTPLNREMDTLPAFLEQVTATGVDALIVADMGVLATAKQVAPNTEIHISTQAGVTNYLTARALYDMGAKRVVLARELSFEDIAEIRDRTPAELEIEAFVHGAMCVSFSGRCLLSNYLVGRDANRGECAQPCRWGYHLMEEKRPGEYYPVFEDESGTYIMNAKDLSMIEHIDKLAKAGIDSFKIEGRGKSAYYVAVVTNAYRNAVDLYLKDPENYHAPDWLVEETRKISHREYSTGFFFGRPQNGQYYGSSGYVRLWDIAAVVQGYKDGRLLCTQRNRFFKGDTLEALIPKGGCLTLQAEELFDAEGNPIESTPHPMMQFQLPFDRPLPEGTILRMQKQENTR